MTKFPGATGPLGGDFMDAIVNLIIGESVSLDVFVIVRLIVFILCLDFFATICAILGGFKK